MRYLDELREATVRAGCAIHAYVLMTNHVHLLVTPAGVGQVGRMMQSPSRRYVRYVNDRYCRTGTLWEGRYKACPVQSDDHLLTGIGPHEFRKSDSPRQIWPATRRRAAAC